MPDLDLQEAVQTGGRMLCDGFHHIDHFDPAAGYIDGAGHVELLGIFRAVAPRLAAQGWDRCRAGLPRP